MKSKLIFSGLVTCLCLIFTINLQANQDEKKARHPQADFTISCKDCHKEISPDIYDQWASSGHGKLNYGCYMCHGDGEVEFYVKPSSDRCISCHADQEVDFTQNKFDSCFDCHQGHTLKFHENE